MNSEFNNCLGQLNGIASRSAAAKPLAPTVRYGLPCANCRIYYPAELTACPVCSCGERVSPKPQ